MIGMPAMNASEPIAPPVSSIPFATKPTELGSLPGILPFKPYPRFLTVPRKPLRHRGIKPMGQPSIELARKLSSRTISHIAQVFDNKHLDLRQVKFLQGREDDRPYRVISMFAAFAECLNDLVSWPGNLLAVRGHPTIPIVRIETKDNTFLFLFRSWLLQDKIDKQPASILAQSDGLPNAETFMKEAVQVLGGFDRDSHLRCARTDKVEREIEGALKCFDRDEVTVKRNSMLSYPGFTCLVSRPHCLLSLFGQGLCQPSRESKTIAPTMNCRKIRELCREFLTLPEKINEVLKTRMADMKECDEPRFLPGIQCIQMYAASPAHHRNFKLRMGLNHCGYYTDAICHNRAYNVLEMEN